MSDMHPDLMPDGPAGRGADPHFREADEPTLYDAPPNDPVEDDLSFPRTDDAEYEDLPADVTGDVAPATVRGELGADGAVMTEALPEPPADVQQGEILGAPTPQGDGVQRDPQDWVTGDDPATEAQKSYLDSLARAAGEQIPADGLTKAQASEHIDRLQALTGRQPREN